MRRASGRIVTSLTGLLLSAVVQDGARSTEPARSGTGATPRVVEGFDRLPLRFEPSADPGGSARYVARGPGYVLSLASTEMVLWLGGGNASPLRVKLLRSRPDADVEGLEELPGTSNYFIGNDPAKWRTNVTGFGKVRFSGVYPGIDLVYYGRGSELEYDFRIAPGADPTLVRLGFEGARDLREDGEGNLVAALDDGEVVKSCPRVYEEDGTRTQAVRGRWVRHGKSEAGFEVGPYDASRVLVIDPVLSYSTYLGGGDVDEAYAIAVDAAGSAYVTGWTHSTDFPADNPPPSPTAFYDVVVTKLSPSGTSLVYSTYLGGLTQTEIGHGIAVDGSGSAYVTGWTASEDFPTVNPFQTCHSNTDMFVAKLSPSGTSLVYSTCLGGSDGDFGRGIAVGPLGGAYVTGWTHSTDFPVLNPIQTRQGRADVVVAKLAPSGNALAYSTYLGGSDDDYAMGIATDASGSAYVTGLSYSTDFPTQNAYQLDQPFADAFVTKLSPSGTSLVYSTYLGGYANDFGSAIAVDASGSAYVTGQTRSPNFPSVTPYQRDIAYWDAFVTKLSPSGTSLGYSTFLGGFDVDEGHAIAVDGAGSAYVTGTTSTSDFPTASPFQLYQGLGDAFVTKLLPSGSGLEYSTYLGGSNTDEVAAIAVDASGNAYVAGRTYSTDFPTRTPYQTDQPMVDAFVTKLEPPPPMDFFTLAPCRLIDTRDPTGPYGGPALSAGADRTFLLAGRCGISATARAVSVNLAVTAPSAPGNLRLYPAGTTLPLVASINYAAGQTRSNNAIVSLYAGGFSARCAQASGTAHLVVDVNGYFE
jgi:hypothetical protein